MTSESMILRTWGEDEGWLYLFGNDGKTTWKVPPGWECPKGLLGPGVTVSRIEDPHTRRFVINGHLVFCVGIVDGRVRSRAELRPAVLGGVPIAASSDTSAEGSTRNRQPELRAMLERNRELPFYVRATWLVGPGDTTVRYNNASEWRLPIKAVRRFLAAELGVEADERPELDGDEIRLPGSFFARPSAVEQLEQALVKLGYSRLDPEFQQWVGSVRTE